MVTQNVESVDEVLRLAGFEGAPRIDDLNLLRQIPDSEKFLNLSYETPRKRTRPDVFEMLVPRTRWTFNLGEFKKVGGDFFAVAIVYCATTNEPATIASAFASMARKLHGSLAQMTEDETELARLIFAKSRPFAYDGFLDLQQVRAAYSGATVSLDDLLDALESKNVIFIRRRDGAIRLVK